MSFARAKPKILALHRWLALVAGLFILSEGLSGSLIAFRYELNRALYPGAMTVAPSPAQPKLAAVIDAAQRAMPGFKIARVDYPRRPDDAYIVRMTGKDQTAAIATVDQSAHVTRTGTLTAWPVELAYAMHEQLMSGEAGKRGLGFIGLCVLLLASSGLLYWWPAARLGRVLANTIKPPLAKGRVTRELHRAIGALSGLYLIVMAIMGTTLAWTPWVQPVVGILLPFAVVEPKAPMGCGKPLPVDDAVAAGAAQRPGQAIKSVRFQAKGRIVAVYFQSHVTYPPRATDRVWLSACDARVLSVDDKLREGPGDKLFAWLLPVHSGEWLGVAGRLMSWTAALALIAMGISGYVLWILRLRKRRRT